MLTHNYQHWYSQYLHLSESQLYWIAGGAATIGVLSALHPDFLSNLARLAAQGAWTRARKLLQRKLGRAGQGVWVGNVFFSDEARVRHMRISGSTGSGKTVLMSHLMDRDIARGAPVIIIDPKGDRTLYEQVRESARRAGRERDLHLLSATYSGESVRWNPCALGMPSELQTKWYNSGIYKEPFYAKACEHAYLKAFTELRKIYGEHSFTLTELLAQMESIKEQKKSDHIEGLCYELENFADSEWAPLLCVNKAGQVNTHQREITIWDIIRKKEILFVDLPTESKKIQSSRIGKLILQELTLVSGLRKAYPHLQGDLPCAVYVDEFDAFASEAFGTFLNKGRSSNFMIHMAHQTIGDLEQVSPAFAKVVLGNPNIHAIFRTDNPDEAEFSARMAGTRTVVKKTFQTEGGITTGRSSNRETEEFLVHPNRIKTLRTGECLLINKIERYVDVIRVPAPGASKPQIQGPVISGPAETNPPQSPRDLGNGADQYVNLMKGQQTTGGKRGK